MTILGLHHVQINVPQSRAAEARRFFEGLLGFEKMPRPASLTNARRDGMWYRCGDNEFHVFLASDGDFAENHSSHHPAFLVDDLTILRARLESAGVEVEEAVPISGRERFFCRDPFGHRFEFLAFV